MFKQGSLQWPQIIALSNILDKGYVACHHSIQTSTVGIFLHILLSRRSYRYVVDTASLLFVLTNVGIPSVTSAGILWFVRTYWYLYFFFSVPLFLPLLVLKLLSVLLVLELLWALFVLELLSVLVV